MLCPSCKHDNRTGRKFCVHCGAGLELACSSCGARSEPGERFACLSSSHQTPFTDKDRNNADQGFQKTNLPFPRYFGGHYSLLGNYVDSGCPSLSERRSRGTRSPP